MKKLIILALVSALAFTSFSQNIAITDDNGYTANPSAMLDVKSTTSGMLVPRMTTLQRDAISNPANGLLIFDIDEISFFFYNGTEWVNLSSGNPNSIWAKSGSDVYLSDTTWNMGIGTKAPIGKLEVQGDVAVTSNDPLFEVINSNGDTVFAVYSQGVRINVADDPAIKATGSRGGFAVGGFSLTKGLTNEYLRVTPDSVRVYIDDDGAKAVGSRGGFAVGGFSLTKGLTNDYLCVSDDSVRVYIDDNSGAKIGASRAGFAVGGFSLSKGITTDYFNISGTDSAEVINPSEARIVWYPTKKAMLSGQVLIESVDSVGTMSIASGNEPKAIGNFSQAFGNHARAFGNNSTAIGSSANAIGDNSYALGNNAISADTASYAIGTGALATGLRSFAVGSQGIDLYNFNVGPTTASGDYSYAFGMGSVTTSQGAFAFGTQDTASGEYSTAIGYQTKAIGERSTALGVGTIASGSSATAMGDNSIASGQSSTAMGGGCTASEYTSFAVGNWNTASGSAAVAMGTNSTASGHNGSVAIGYLTEASGGSSVALGYTTTASGDQATAIGENTIASGQGATALGNYIIAAGSRSFGIGLDNPWPSSWTITQDNTMSIMGGMVGIGTVDPDKLLHVAGDARIEGDLYYGTGASIYTKPDFVFSPDYENNFEIEFIERYIKKNGHLPWVTSAKDEKDGVNITRMTFETLESVENQQLQIIELEKKNKTHKEVIDNLVSRLKELENQLAKIK